MANKLLLLEDVDALGRSGDVVSVRPGYARNFLLPRGLALVADKRALRMQLRLQEERRKKAIQDKNEADQIAASFEGVALTIHVKVDHDGHMYGSVSSLDIARLLHEQVQIDIEKRAIQLKHPIKELGVHTIPLKLKEGVTASLVLKVISDAVDANAPQPAEA